MEDSDQLRKIAFPIEAAICALDRSRNFTLQDSQAIEIFEMLLDFYAFRDSEALTAEKAQLLGCELVLGILEQELAHWDENTIAKVLGVVRHVARRRAKGGREHLNVLHRYTGSFVSSGVGLRLLEDGTELVVGQG